ncbi:MAG: NADH/ubiquinone/plastoquinone, partial [Dermatophilaceae bacterium]|nr:NADH/ubiquinone/plastoquinone [Dermatophilaceae bacterium]
MKGLSIDYATLLPALSPVAGLVLVLLADLFAPRGRRLPWGIAGLASAASAAATLPGLGLGGGSTRETFCIIPTALPAGGGRLPSVEGLPRVCLWSADALGST